MSEVEEIIGEIEDICCDLQEGVEYTERKKERFSECNRKLNMMVQDIPFGEFWGALW